MTTYREAFADAQAALPFVIEQGRNIESQIYRRKYPTLEYASHIPVITEGNDWAIGTTFFTVDGTGQAKFLSGGGNDMPFNQVTRDMASHSFYMLGSGWEWNLEEVNQSALYGIALNTEKAFYASRSVDQMLYDIAMVGSTEKNWKGFCNSTLVPRADAASTGTGSSTYWKDKTVDNILADVNDLLTGIRTVTKEIEWADTLRLPPSAFRLAATRRLGAGDGMITLLEYLRQNNIYTAETGSRLDIGTIRDLETASQDGGGRMVAYRKDPEVLRFHLPMPKRQLDPRSKSLMGFETGLIARTGGVEIRLPYAMSYLDEITPVPS